MNPPSHSLFPPADQRILVRGVNWLGDAVMTTPALLRLRERFPDAHIALLTPHKLLDLWRQHPSVNEAIGFAPADGLFGISRKLRKGQFDLALVLPNSPRSALEVWLAQIPLRIGYARPWRNWLLTQALSPRPGAVRMRKRSVSEIKRLMALPPDAAQNPKPKTQDLSSHQIHEYLQLFSETLGTNPEPVPPQLFVSPLEVGQVKQKFDLGRIPQPVFALNAGAEYGPAKRWPIERFIAAAREIQKRTKGSWLILGGKSEEAIGEQIYFELRTPQFASRNLAGRTSLRELCAILKLCGGLVSNDSGTMHLAAALGTPVVVLFGSTSPELTGPGLPGSSQQRLRLLQADPPAPCSPCFLRRCPIDFRCMTGISVERVADAAIDAARL